MPIPCPTYPLYSDSVTKVLSYEDLFKVNAGEKLEREEKARAVRLEKAEEEYKRYHYSAKINLLSGGNYGYTFRILPQNEMLLDSENLDLIKWITK